MVLMAINTAGNPAPPQNSNIKIVITWPIETNADVDLWAKRELNQNSITGYWRRENDVFILHNDNTSNQYGSVDGKTLDIAREEMTIEKPVPDKYYFSLHGYNLRQNKEVAVQVQIYQANPYNVILDKKVLVLNGLETPICSFRLGPKNQIYDIISQQNLLRKIIAGL